MAAFQNFQDFLDYLDQLGLFKVQLGLERMDAALAALGLSKPPFFIAQVLGTNGKGSTASFLDTLARAHGLKTGLYTSPHFISPKERILINGEQVLDAEWLIYANKLMELVPGARNLSYFEFLTILAILLFEGKGVQFAVLEAGLGGKNDATTALPANIQLFTPIGIDHAAIIGPELSDIARDKAWAIKTQSQVCSALQEPAVRKIICEMAEKNKATISWVANLPPKTGLAGEHQLINSALACLAFEKVAANFAIMPSKASIAHALNEAFIPGRLQLLNTSPPLLLDGGHNPHALHKILPEAQKILGKEISIIFSVLADKDWTKMVEILAQNFPTARFFIPTLANSRALAASTLVKTLNSILPEQAYLAKDTVDALDQAKQANLPTLATGSLYLLSEIYLHKPQFLRQTGDKLNAK